MKKKKKSLKRTRPWESWKQGHLVRTHVLEEENMRFLNSINGGCSGKKPCPSAFYYYRRKQTLMDKDQMQRKTAYLNLFSL